VRPRSGARQAPLIPPFPFRQTVLRLARRLRMNRALRDASGRADRAERDKLKLRVILKSVLSAAKESRGASICLTVGPAGSNISAKRLRRITLCRRSSAWLRTLPCTRPTSEARRPRAVTDAAIAAIRGENL